MLMVNRKFLGDGGAGAFRKWIYQAVKENRPYDKFADRTEYADLVWAPCGEERNLNVNTELRVYPGASNPQALSFMSMDSTDGSVSTVYHFAWKECPGV